MSTEVPQHAQGVSSLADWLATISSSDQLDNLDPGFHRALRVPAKELVARGCEFGVAELGEVDSSSELSALSAAVHLRSFEVVAFWRPLLKSCLTGKSAAPLADLQSTTRQASALVDRLSVRPSSPVRDEVLRLATEAEERTGKWLPQSANAAGLPTAPTRYSRGAFERTEDEDGNPLVRPPPAPEEVGPPPESALRSAVGWLMTAVAVAAMAVGLWTYSNQAPQPLPLSHYQAFLSEAVDKRIVGTELVLTVGAAWPTKTVERRATELERLWGGGGTTEPYDAIRVVDEQGALLARYEPPGGPEWSETLRPKTPGTEAPASEDSSDGMLKTPLRADEIPLGD
jgi:hypothetical protein